MRDGLDWYKRKPRLYLGGVQGLTAQQHAVYGVTLDLIYAHGGSINNDPRWIAGWIADMGAAAVRRTISELVEAGKLIVEGEMLTNARAKNQTKTGENHGENPEKTGENHGENASFLEEKDNKNNGISKSLTRAIEEDKSREEKKGDADASRDETDPTFRERLLAACQVDPSGMTGRGGNRIGTQADMAIAGRWTSPAGLALSEAECIAVVAETRAKMRGPPGSFSYFDGPMADLAAAKAAPAPQLPATTGSAHVAAFPDRSEKRRTDRAERDRRVLIAAARGTTGPPG